MPLEEKKNIYGEKFNSEVYRAPLNRHQLWSTEYHLPAHGPDLGVRCGGCFALHHAHALGTVPASLAKWGHSRAGGCSGGTEPAPAAPVTSPPSSASFEENCTNIPKSLLGATLWAVWRAAHDRPAHPSPPSPEVRPFSAAGWSLD